MINNIIYVNQDDARYIHNAFSTSTKLSTVTAEILLYCSVVNYTTLVHQLAT